MGLFKIAFFLAICALGDCVPTSGRLSPTGPGRLSPPAPQAAAAFSAPNVLPSVPDVVTITQTISVFGPVAIETVTETITATQMINAGTTTDYRLTDTTNVVWDRTATSTSRDYTPLPAETITSVVSEISQSAGDVATSTDFTNMVSIVTLTNTKFRTRTASSVSTCTIEHFSTNIQIEVIPISMTTTLFETNTKTQVVVVRTTTTTIVPNPYYPN
ncbi:unnamed protein product [Meganyctiphanes norvegica]|uniref:Uncharacterized protein n=1 Tax=Meganyctiphanes norvegica TaxID=48144 RepID=A0AAV2SY37_MEGNR